MVSWDLIIIFGNLCVPRRNLRIFPFPTKQPEELETSDQHGFKKEHGQYEAVNVKYVFDTNTHYFDPIWKFPHCQLYEKRRKKPKK
uniref:39S ribosomal protein L42, mitochondrial n=1 Tax=Bursaphelenchus xylophilus TaxID=6326 RepID=A0A1I7SJJ2_BURXY